MDAGAGSEHVLRPLRRGNAFEETVERLLQLVRLGVVGPGGRLPPERELAARLGVSRTTLRDALATLRDEHYLVVRRGRQGGTFVVAAGPGAAPRPVAGLGAESLEDVLTLRLVLECGAAEAAAVRGPSAADRARLLAGLARCRAASLQDYRAADSQLHLTVADLSGSPSLVAAVADVRIRVNDLLDAIPLLASNIRHTHAQHARVVHAVLDRDPVAAREAVTEHLMGSAALLRAFLS